MTFQPIQQKPPVRVQNVSILLEYKTDEQGNPSYDARYRFTLVDEDGQKVSDPLESGDLMQYLSAQEKQDAKNFLDAQVSKVEGRLG